MATKGIWIIEFCARPEKKNARWVPALHRAYFVFFTRKEALRYIEKDAVSLRVTKYEATR